MITRFLIPANICQINTQMYILIGHIKLMGNKAPYDGDWNYWSTRTGKYPGVRKEVSTLLKQQKNKCAFCG